ncbi:MAG: DUF2249 domain-containing protein [Planctomycetes bacterium]|nr:DUF2249 domain-containing protein [Planctomycetota bacterium]
MHELDVRELPPATRHPQIFQAFDCLPAGGAFVLVNDHNPRPLLYQFQMERAGRFEWNVLESGPERFRVEIRRRETNGLRHVTEYLQTDHRRLDALLGVVERLVEAGSTAEASARFAEFACGLNHHIEAEEQLLFPTFEEATGTREGPTAVMRAEHVEIRGFMEAVGHAIERQDRQGVAAFIRGLKGVLVPHNVKEEQVLYPMTDQSAGDERQRDELVRKMQAL